MKRKLVLWFIDVVQWRNNLCSWTILELQDHLSSYAYCLSLHTIFI